MSLALVGFLKGVLEHLDSSRFLLISGTQEHRFTLMHQSNGTSLDLLLHTANLFHILNTITRKFAEGTILHGKIHSQRRVGLFFIREHLNNLKVLEYMLPNRVCFFRILDVVNRFLLCLLVVVLFFWFGKSKFPDVHAAVKRC
jgi:hypothetical protein